jgi:hypothetical protein
MVALPTPASSATASMVSPPYGLGARWMRVLWRAWTDGVPYDEARHLKTGPAREVLTDKPIEATAAA